MNSFDIRRYQTAAPDDLPALARLLAETPEIATSGEDISEAMLRAQYEWPGHQPTRDRWVAEATDEPGALAGYACVFKSPATPRADLLLVVHPAWRRRGLGRELLRRALDGARALGATEVSCYAEEMDAGAAAFAATHGFAPVAAFTRLSAPGDTSLFRARAARWLHHPRLSRRARSAAVHRERQHLLRRALGPQRRHRR